MGGWVVVWEKGEGGREEEGEEGGGEGERKGKVVEGGREGGRGRREWHLWTFPASKE